MATTVLSFLSKGILIVLNAPVLGVNYTVATEHRMTSQLVTLVLDQAAQTSLLSGAAHHLCHCSQTCSLHSLLQVFLFLLGYSQRHFLGLVLIICNEIVLFVEHHFLGCIFCEVELVLFVAEGSHESGLVEVLHAFLELSEHQEALVFEVDAQELLKVWMLL